MGKDEGVDNMAPVRGCCCCELWLRVMSGVRCGRRCVCGRCLALVVGVIELLGTYMYIHVHHMIVMYM